MVQFDRNIQLGAENGLDLLKSIAEPSFETIFVTAYDEYAVRAFRTQAADYLLKPIDIDDLQDAIQKVKVKITSKTETVRKEDNLAEVVVDAKVTGTFIKVITQDGYELVSVEDIIYLKSINYYTNIVLNDNREIITSKTLKEYQNQLKDANFLRIHNSYIINLKYLKGVISKESNYVKLVNDVQIGISRRRKDDFLSFLKNKSIKITKF